MRKLILFLALSACGSDEQVAYTTVHGIVVLEGDSDMPVDQEDIEIATEIVVDDMVARHPETFTRDGIMERLMERTVKLQFTSGLIPGAPKTSLGRTHPMGPLGDSLIIVRDVDPFDFKRAEYASRTGLTHELMHAVQLLYGIADEDHNEKDYFKNKHRTIEENFATVEMEIHNDYSMALCPKYCNF